MTGIIYIPLVLILIVLSLPLMALVALMVVVSSGMPIIFRQTRIGKNGKPFTLYKFRTMVNDAEREKKKLLPYNESSGPAFKIYNDPRFTRIGRFLSHTGLDELPQLFNVLTGDMSLVGPRPLPVSEAKKLVSWMQERHTVLPGIISPAILTGKYHKNFTAWMKSDVLYIRTKTFWSDVALLFQFLPFLVGLQLREMIKAR